MSGVSGVEILERERVKDELPQYILIHRNVDVDAIVSAFIYNKVVCKQMAQILTEENIDDIPEESRIAILDMPMSDELAKKIAAKKLTVVAHYDHHEGEYKNYPSTAAILAEKLELEPWMKILVELANFCDTGQQLKLCDEAKLFHISGFINATRTAGFSDTTIINDVYIILHRYEAMLKQIIEAREMAKRVPLFEAAGYKVAVVEKPSTHVNKALFDLGVDLIIYKDGYNLGITRNAAVTQPDLNTLKPVIQKMLEEKGKPEEFKEWFFHPAGFIACRGSRKHPASSESVLSPEDLVKAIEEACKEV